MIIDYGYSIQGKSHVKRNIVCQDSHYIRKMKNGWVVAAAADGVGSASNAEIGSRLAAKNVVDFCCDYMPLELSTENILSLLRTAYNYALGKIFEEAKKSGQPIESYDTTLSTVIYTGNRVFYGHSGDGAIIGLNPFGEYVEITEPQKGSDNVSVIPLRGGSTTWVIDTYSEELAAVVIVTDGMLQSLSPYLLRNSQNSLYVPLISFFADPAGFSENEVSNEREKKAIGALIEAADTYKTEDFYGRLLKIYSSHIPQDAERIVDSFTLKNYPLYFIYKEEDDKTVVGLINTEAHVMSKESDYYGEPYWDKLKDEWNRKAYPHLYEKDISQSTADDAEEKNNDSESAEVPEPDNTQPNINSVYTNTVINNANPDNTAVNNADMNLKRPRPLPVTDMSSYSATNNQPAPVTPTVPVIPTTPVATAPVADGNSVQNTNTTPKTPQVPKTVQKPQKQPKPKNNTSGAPKKSFTAAFLRALFKG